MSHLLMMMRASFANCLKLLKYPILAKLSKVSTQQDGVNQKKIVMYFVIPPGETQKQAMKRSVGEMYQMAEAHFLIVEWIKDEECQNVVLEDNGNIFVFDDFDSPGFKFWEENARSNPFQVEILGPQVLRYIFTSKDVIKFTTRGVPTFTLAMRNMRVSLSGFKDMKVKDDIENKVRWMNGEVSASLTLAVTHVITLTALTEKSIETRKRGNSIPLMTVDWVKKVWEDNHTASIDASDMRYVEYSCPMFYNIRICMSQISVTKKNTLKLAVEQRGGKCIPDMIKGKTDVLVVTSPEGDKYKYAKKWKILCVNPQWIKSSLDQGRLLSPDEFKITDVEEGVDLSDENTLRLSWGSD